MANEIDNTNRDAGERACMSRRQILRGAAVAAGSAAVLGSTILPAEAKMAQSAASYQTTPKNGASCATCSFFSAPSSCSLVDGTISASGWCRFYSKKA